MTRKQPPRNPPTTNQTKALHLLTTATHQYTSTQNPKPSLKTLLKAQTLHPSLPNISTLITTFKILTLSANKSCNHNFYDILGVEPFSHINTIRSHYKKLALLLHPDKNKCVGSEDAFKIIGEAFNVLNDKKKRKEHDLNLRIEFQEQVGVEGGGMETFWTACSTCRLFHEFERKYVNEYLLCPNCDKRFLGVEVTLDDYKSSRSGTDNEEERKVRGEKRGEEGKIGKGVFDFPSDDDEVLASCLGKKNRKVTGNGVVEEGVREEERVRVEENVGGGEGKRGKGLFEYPSDDEVLACLVKKNKKVVANKEEKEVRVKKNVSGGKGSLGSGLFDFPSDGELLINCLGKKNKKVVQDEEELSNGKLLDEEKVRARKNVGGEIAKLGIRLFNYPSDHEVLAKCLERKKRSAVVNEEEPRSKVLLDKNEEEVREDEGVKGNVSGGEVKLGNRLFDCSSDEEVLARGLVKNNTKVVANEKPSKNVLSDEAGGEIKVNDNAHALFDDDVLANCLVNKTRKVVVDQDISMLDDEEDVGVSSNIREEVNKLFEYSSDDDVLGDCLAQKNKNVVVSKDRPSNDVLSDEKETRVSENVHVLDEEEEEVGVDSSVWGHVNSREIQLADYLSDNDVLASCLPRNKKGVVNEAEPVRNLLLDEERVRVNNNGGGKLTPRSEFFDNPSDDDVLVSCLVKKNRKVANNEAETINHVSSDEEDMQVSGYVRGKLKPRDCSLDYPSDDDVLMSCLVEKNRKAVGNEDIPVNYLSSDEEIRVSKNRGKVKPSNMFDYPSESDEDILGRGWVKTRKVSSLEKILDNRSANRMKNIAVRQKIVVTESPVVVGNRGSRSSLRLSLKADSMKVKDDGDMTLAEMQEEALRILNAKRAAKLKAEARALRNEKERERKRKAKERPVMVAVSEEELESDYTDDMGDDDSDDSDFYEFGKDMVEKERTLRRTRRDSIMRKKRGKGKGVMMAPKSSIKDIEIMAVNDADFYNFDKDRVERSFKIGQVWALYNDDDGMPRHYGLIEEVSLYPFNVKMSWLNLENNGDKLLISWEKSGFHVTCGRFKVGGQTAIHSVNVFSHKVDCERVARQIYRIYPEKGSIWVVYSQFATDGDKINQMLSPNQCYEIVVFLTSYSEMYGLSMAFLEKVEGFNTIYKRREIGYDAIQYIEQDDVRMFSHQIPAKKLSGTDLPESLRDCWELDPASLPPELPSISC